MSRAIARLEAELGTSLFDVVGGRTALTGPGAVLQGHAQAILAALQVAKDDVAQARGQVSGKVMLGSTLHTGRLDLATVFSGIRDRYPGVVIQLCQSKAGSLGLVQAVLDGSMDIALTASTGSPPGVVLHRLFSEPMVFVCRPGHRLGRRTRITVSDLQGQEILRPPPGWGTRAAIDAALGPAQSGHEVSNYALMAGLVREGFDPTLVPASAMSEDMLAGLQAVPVDDPSLCWTLSAAVRAGSRVPAATKVLLDALIQGSADCAGDPASPAIP